MSLLPRHFHTSAEADLTEESKQLDGHINVNVSLSSESLGNPKDVLVD